MDQVGCQYVPHVMGIMVGQTFKVLNSDGILHNVHALPKVNSQFNMAMPPARKEATATFGKEEGMFTVKCDVHPWMQSYIGVFSHPFFAVTKPDGKFSLANLDAGTYEIEAWHERLGTQKATVTLGAGDTKPVGFKFSRPRSRARRETAGRPSMAQPTVTAPHHAAPELHHEELGFWRRYVFSVDHKTIGIQYAVTGLLFLLFGFSLMMLMRWQLAYPGSALPLLGSLLGDKRMPGG